MQVWTALVVVKRAPTNQCTANSPQFHAVPGDEFIYPVCSANLVGIEPAVGNGLPSSNTRQ